MAQGFKLELLGQGAQHGDKVMAMGLVGVQGIKLRDTTSFGLPEHVRLGVLSPPAQDALSYAWQQILRRHKAGLETAPICASN